MIDKKVKFMPRRKRDGNPIEGIVIAEYENFYLVQTEFYKTCVNKKSIFVREVEANV